MNECTHKVSAETAQVLLRLIRDVFGQFHTGTPPEEVLTDLLGSLAEVIPASAFPVEPDEQNDRCPECGSKPE